MTHRQRHMKRVKDDLKLFGKDYEKKVLQGLKTITDKDYIFYRQILHILGWNNRWFNNELIYYCSVKRKQQFYNILEDLIVNGFGRLFTKHFHQYLNSTKK